MSSATATAPTLFPDNSAVGLSIRQKLVRQHRLGGGGGATKLGIEYARNGVRETATTLVPRDEVIDFLNAVVSAAKTSTRRSLFIVFDALDRWMTEGKFAACDEALRKAPLASLPNEVALGFLSITKPAKDRLKARVPLVDRLKKLYRARALDEKEILELLGGLE